jgi:hypothetical protein
LKNLLKILFVGTAFFLVLAIVQEWQYFSAAWFGSPAVIAEPPEAERKAAADTVYELLTLMEHFYGSGGDRRFAERMPASATVVDEQIEDVQYLGRSHRVQEMSLERLEVTAVESVREEVMEIRTREFWSVRFQQATEGGGAEPQHPFLAYRKYLLSRGAGGWTVEGWDLAEPEPPQRESK